MSLRIASVASLRVAEALDAQQCSSGVIAQFDPEQLVLGKCPNFAITTEAKIGTPAFDLDLANQHASAVPNIDTVAATRVDVPEDITFDAVGHSRIGVGEDSTIGEVWIIVLPENTVGVDGRCAPRILRSIAVNKVCVCDVHDIFTGRKTKAIRTPKSICYDTNIAS